MAFTFKDGSTEKFKIKAGYSFGYDLDGTVTVTPVPMTTTIFGMDMLTNEEKLVMTGEIPAGHSAISDYATVVEAKAALKSLRPGVGIDLSTVDDEGLFSFDHVLVENVHIDRNPDTPNGFKFSITFKVITTNLMV